VVVDCFNADRSRKQDLLRSLRCGLCYPCRVTVANPHPSRAAYDELRQDFRAALPELHAALRAIPYSDGQLRTTRQARNYDCKGSSRIFIACASSVMDVKCAAARGVDGLGICAHVHS